MAHEGRADTHPPVRNPRWWLVALMALGLFAILATQVGSGTALAALDRDFAKALDEAATPGWREFFKAVTLFGTGWTLGVASGVVAGVLLLRRRFVLGFGFGLAQLGAVLLVKAVKAMVERDRPGLGDPAFYAHGWSFPSGHVVRTVAFCAMGSYLIYRLSGSRSATVMACSAGLAWSLVMAFSRIYLGAHFATDVAGGLLLATAWVAVCVAAIEAQLSKW